MASGSSSVMRGAVAVVVALAAACGAQLPARHAPPPDGSYDAATYQVEFGDTIEPVRGAAVSRAFFEAPGVSPMMGRLFIEPEYETPPPRVAVIGHSLWVDRFGSEAGVIGREIEIDGSPVLVVGVLPRGFAFPDGARLWIPRVGVSRAVEGQ